MQLCVVGLEFDAECRPSILNLLVVHQWENTRRVLCEVFSHGVALQLNFTGRGSKVGISGMRLSTAIKGNIYYKTAHYDWASI